MKVGCKVIGSKELYDCWGFEGQLPKGVIGTLDSFNPYSHDEDEAGYYECKWDGGYNGYRKVDLICVDLELYLDQL